VDGDCDYRGVVEMSEPSYIPVWQGFDPVRFWISPEMRRFESEIRGALDTFERERMPDGRALRLHFREIFAPQQVRCIDFRMEPLVGLLGLGMYPPPLNEEPAAGDVTLNADAFSRPEFRPLILPTLIHELAAHALGLGHFWRRGSVRCPLIEEDRINLSDEDRMALVTLYGV
jgi:hypothetical protein